MNVYSFTGRLSRDCEVRTTQSGMAICSFTVAVDYGFGDNKGVNWMRVSLFGKRAEGGLPNYLKKGTQVGISGELRIREYKDKDGVDRTSVEVSANSVDLLGSKQDNAQGGQPQSRQQPAQQQGYNKNPDPFGEGSDHSLDEGEIPF